MVLFDCLLTVFGFCAYFPFLYGLKQVPKVDSKRMMVIDNEDPCHGSRPSAGVYPRVFSRGGIYKEDWMRLQEMRVVIARVYASSQTQSESKEDSRLGVFFTRLMFLRTTKERAAGE
jgi:hypothetical protein